MISCKENEEYLSYLNPFPHRPDMILSKFLVKSVKLGQPTKADPVWKIEGNDDFCFTWLLVFTWNYCQSSKLAMQNIHPSIKLQLYGQLVFCAFLCFSLRYRLSSRFQQSTHCPDSCRSDEAGPGGHSYWACLWWWWWALRLCQYSRPTQLL